MVSSDIAGSSAVGMDELLSSNSSRHDRERRQRRQSKNKRKERPKQGFFRTLIQVIGELLITAGVVLLLFVAWELWWTNIDADIAQKHAVNEFVQGLDIPDVPPVEVPSKPNYGEPKVISKDVPQGETFGVAYIPRFGKEYYRPLVQGTTQTQLDTLGLGHYESTTMPGAVGNFAVAGHRQTHGAVLDAIHTLVPGDKIYVQTKAGYYTYVFRNNQIVLPNATDVLLPVPTQKDAKPTQRFMTMTSCNPRFGAEERIIAYSVMESWQPLSAGPPKEIAAAVAKIKKDG